MFLDYAANTSFMYEDFVRLLTRPAVDSLLMPRQELPPGYQHNKVLVLNLSGTLVHTEYKLGVGFEVMKRPGLSMFLQRLARYYELVFFGDQEQGFVMEISEALDP